MSNTAEQLMLWFISKLYGRHVNQPITPTSHVVIINCLHKQLTDWCIVCLQMNVGGASDRPVPADIWKIVQAKMENPDSEQNVRIQKRGLFSVFSKH